MRYEEMARRYPWVEECFGDVAARVRMGKSVEEAVAVQIWRVQAMAADRHSKAILDKLGQWARVVKDNSTKEADPAPNPVASGPALPSTYLPDVREIAGNMRAGGLSLCGYCTAMRCRLCEFREEDWG